MIEERNTPRGARAQEEGKDERPTVATVSSAATTDDTVPLEPFGSTKRYEVDGLLGEGGMGEVRLCTDRQIGRKVAMKVMRGEAPSSSAMRARFLREARVQGQTEHPAIVPVYDVGTDEAGSLYFTMRRVEGRTLGEILNGVRDKTDGLEREYTRHKLLTAFGSVCLGVHFAHTRGVFHCDLKPSNVMLGAFGEVYVLDWGLAALARDSKPEAASGEGDAARAVSGTPGYMAPEQVRGEAPDARSDVYALGALLYELLTLTPMHQGRSPRELFAETLDGTIEPPCARAPERDIPPELEAVCMQATTFSRRRRYPTARDLYEDLERYMEGDRDLQSRRAMSTKHAARAAELAARVRQGGSDSNELRSDAMRTVSRALALDPDNPEALRTLVGLLTDPPRDAPPEAVEDMRAMERGLDRVRASWGTVAIVLWAVGTTALCAAAGIRSMALFVFTTLTLATAATMSVVRLRYPRPDGFAPTYTTVAFCVAVFGMSVGFHPFLLTPAITLPFAIGYTLSMDRGRRFLPMIGCSVAMLLPVVLEWVHALPESLTFRGGLLCMVPRMSEFYGAASGAASPLPVAVNLVTMLIGCIFAVRFRDALTDSHRRVALNSWQLRLLLPREAGPATMPPPA